VACCGIFLSFKQAGGSRIVTTESNPEFDEKHLNEARQAWCQTYVRVWSDLSKGVYDKEVVGKAADGHWQKSPESDPVLIASVEFTR
jgi:hypothetical protein